MRVLGIEGTAWAASAAVYDAGTDVVVMETDAYQPESGGIHPREAAEHMHEAIPAVVERVLGRARDEMDTDGDDRSDDSGFDSFPVDAVAFSRGPGLGPCLRTVGTAARSLAMTHDLALVGVNHMVAHLEVGRHRAGFGSPVCLNASGANAHVLGYRDGRYRVLGETMDTGVGNAIDKFTRHVGWSHPGGPKVEAAAEDGEYVDLPYVVKGMDFSFAGITSAAKEAYDDGVPVEDVCHSLQETVFAMLAEVAERALSLTGSDELVVGGGVAQNDRLQAVLEEMTADRGADLHVPEDRFLRDNAGMIAVLGAKMLAAGDTVAVEDSRVRPDFRPDEVPVTWRSGEAVGGGDGAGTGGDSGANPDEESEVQGAEAVVTVGEDRVVKRRLPRSYRHPDLDARLRRDRTVLEARLLGAARRAGVPTPVVRDVDPERARLVMERVGAAELGEALTGDRVRAVGRHLAALHGAGLVHGDPTPRNARVGSERTYLVDFGLGYHSDDVEDHAMDLQVLSRSLDGTADDADRLRAALESAYAAAGDEAVLRQLREIEGRGRYQ